MKKILTVLFALMMVFTLAGCGSQTEKVKAKNTYADFVASDGSNELELLMSVQDHESWWDGKVTVYCQDDDGGYLCYELQADEATANAMTPGTLILVKGYKGEWSGEVELVDATATIIAGGQDGKVYDPVDLTSLIGNNDELIKNMNKKAIFKNLTVVDYSPVSDSEDGYLNLTDANGNAITFVVRRYLTAPGSEIANAVGDLKAGDVVDLTAFIYWYEGPQPRIIKVDKH